MILFDKVSKTYPGGVRAVKELSLEVREGETLVLLGTSGSGKTTSMKMVNRLIEPTSGRILIDGQDIMEQDPITLRRKIGYAVQHIGLFPHMTVNENIAVVPQLLRWDKDRIAQRTEDLLSLVGLEPGAFGNRYPSQLSGGQKQRIGVARCLAADPPIVLMDEPFGALDPITREELQDEFIALESEINKTIIFVTHDVFEAVKMGDMIALLDDGTLQQYATPSELVENPANEFIDQFLGQHRFQLALLTATVKNMMQPANMELEKENVDRGFALHQRDSLLHALDLFKRSKAFVLPVLKDKKVVGQIEKSALTSEISKIIGQSTERKA